MTLRMGVWTNFRAGRNDIEIEQRRLIACGKLGPARHISAASAPLEPADRNRQVATDFHYAHYLSFRVLPFTVSLPGPSPWDCVAAFLASAKRNRQFTSDFISFHSAQAPPHCLQPLPKKEISVFLLFSAGSLPVFETLFQSRLRRSTITIPGNL